MLVNVLGSDFWRKHKKVCLIAKYLSQNLIHPVQPDFQAVLKLDPSNREIHQHIRRNKQVGIRIHYPKIVST